VRRPAGGPNSGVEVELIAALPAGLPLEPFEQHPPAAPATAVGPHDQVVDVQVPPPRQGVTDPETGGSGGLLIPIDERAHQAVALGSLRRVDPIDHLVHGTEVTPQLDQGCAGEMRLPDLDLAHRDAGPLLRHVQSLAGLRLRAQPSGRTRREIRFPWTGGLRQGTLVLHEQWSDCHAQL
jgi:hypothetical protein